MEVERALCTLSGESVHHKNFGRHKTDLEMNHYGILWPTKSSGKFLDDWRDIPMISCPRLAAHLGVRAVTIRYEGANESGSMKDYITEAVMRDKKVLDSKIFSVVSSGNHAVSLAEATRKRGFKAVVFTPSSSHKFEYLGRFPHILAVGIENTVFEDVYRIATQIDFGNTITNANVSNDFLFTAYSIASDQIQDACNAPTHILSGVGNGTHLAGFGYGMQESGNTDVKIMPVGMDGAFPTQLAHDSDMNFHEYDDFLLPEEEICAAEGSIALASYSMPQLLHSVRSSKGSPLGGLRNSDLTRAYGALVDLTDLLELGFVPEPTGIMSLAAALKHESQFSHDDHLVLILSGAGYKDAEGVLKYGGRYANKLTRNLEIPDTGSIQDSAQSNTLVVPNSIDPIELRDRILDRVDDL